MAQFTGEPNWDDLGEIFQQAFRASPKSYEQALRRQKGGAYELSPVAEMASSSPVTSYLKQALPNRVGDTEIGRAAADFLPERVQEAARNIRLGGMTPEAKAEYSQARSMPENVELRRDTVEIGKVPTTMGPEEATLGAGQYRAKAAQAAGVVAADLASDGMRNIWWFLNAPQAIAQVAMFQGMRQASEKATGPSNPQDPSKGGFDQRDYVDANEPLLKRRSVRMAAAAPAWIAASMGIGNFLRQPGYKAVLPSENDPTQTTDPIAELGSRYFLGRNGSLLPYDEFRKERPDVSKAEYNQYQNYLFSGKSPIKATADGIQGPEVTFMGKSIPLATGILPMAAAVIGARRGIRKGVQRVASDPKGGYKEEKRLKEEVKKLQQSKEPVDEKTIEEAFYEYRKKSEENESQVLKSVLMNSSAATAGTALSGYVLESMRRALKGRASQYSEDEEN
jgi:hypothetical protein